MPSTTRQPNPRPKWMLLIAKFVAVGLWLNACAIGAIPPTTPGGVINGNLYASVGSSGRRPIQLTSFPLQLKEVETNSVIGYALSDPIGNYLFAALSPGVYQVCWEQPGWVTGCSPEEIQVGRDTTSYPANLFITPAISKNQAGNVQSGVVFGNVRLPNGTLPIFHSSLFVIDVKTEVELLDQDDFVIQGPIEPNFNGDFIFTNVPSTVERVRARFGNDVVEGEISDNTNILTGENGLDLTFTNHPPVIRELKAELAGQTRDNDTPIVTVHVDVYDEDDDLLTYQWAVVESTAEVTGREDRATWRLPKAPGLYTIYLLVEDEKGGYAAGDLTLSNTIEQVVDPDEALAEGVARGEQASAGPVCQKLTDAHGPLPNYIDFLTLGYYVGNAAVKDAEAYYKAVDPKHKRTNLRDWWEVNKFNRETGLPEAAGAVSEHLDYLNNSALGVGRDVHCLKQLSGNVACYVTNYGFADQEPDNANFAAQHYAPEAGKTVAMEYAPIEGSPYITPVVKFFAFEQLGTEDGVRIEGLHLGGNDFAYLPTLCLYCHGGQYRKGPGTDPANLGASFREFDSARYCFPGSRLQPNPDEARTIHRLNQIVLDTNPALAIQELIRNWYPSANDDTPINFVPADWQVREPSSPVQPSTLYSDIVSKSCRTCHIAYAEHRRSTWSTYAQFEAKKNKICDMVFAHPQMPHAQIPYNNFWRVFQDQPDPLATYLGYDWTAGADGCPTP